MRDGLDTRVGDAPGRVPKPHLRVRGGSRRRDGGIAVPVCDKDRADECCVVDGCAVYAGTGDERSTSGPDDAGMPNETIHVLRNGITWRMGLSDASPRGAPFPNSM